MYRGGETTRAYASYDRSSEKILYVPKTVSKDGSDQSQHDGSGWVRCGNSIEWKFEDAVSL